MKLISFGNLEYNYYFKNDIITGIEVGGSNLFILENLSNSFNTLYIYNGTDEYKLLDKLNTKSICLEDNKVKKIYRENNNYTSICPYCNRLSKYNYKIINKEKLISYIDEDDELIIDNIDENTLNIIDSINNNCYLLLKYISSIDSLSYEELINKLKDKFKIITLSKNVYNYIRSKYKIDDVDLYNELGCKLLIIFYDNKGCTLIYNDNIVEKENEEFSIVDYYGGIEAFVSSFISSYIINKKIDDKVVSLAYIKAMNNYMRSTSINGAISHLKPINKVTSYDICICEKISLKQ